MWIHDLHQMDVGARLAELRRVAERPASPLDGAIRQGLGLNHQVGDPDLHPMSAAGPLGPADLEIELDVGC